MTTPAQGSSSRRPRDPASGEVDIGGFRRKEEIGRGSFATVYRGAHAKKRGAVAIKSVNLSKLVNKKLKDNLFGEIKILKELHHPHIVSLIDCVEAPSHIHLVMEYCQLGDLSNFIKRRDSWIHKACTTEMMQKYPNPPAGGLNEVVVRHFLQQLASALEFLRKDDLIHRDVKPQNLLLNPSPMYFVKAGKETMPFTPSENSLIPVAGVESLPMLKIADFGFARSLPATSLAETLCGSPLYMAPEILRYERYDAKADLWSVGTVLFEMMVGKPPFRASNHVELLRKIEKGEDRIKFTDDIRISDAMKKLIRGLLRRNPVERMGFNDFFQNTVLRDEIPGLVGEDRPRQIEEQQTLTQPVPPTLRETRHSSSEARDGIANGQARSYRQTSTGSNDGTSRPKVTPRSSTEQHVSANSRRQPMIGSPISEEPRRRTRTDGSDSPEIFHDAEERVPPRRPSIVSHPTAPARPDLPTRQAQRATGMKRTSIEQIPPSPTRITSNFSPYALERARRQSEEKAAREREERERIAANEVAFERDYVVVEKRAVEVNALADELAASPMVQGLKQQKGASTANANKEPSAQTAPLTNVPSNDTRGTLVKRPGQHIRKESFERRPRPFPSTSYITKAMNAASGRLMSFGYSPPFGTARGPSPPSYNPFPSYPITEGSILLINDSAKPAGTVDEDTKHLHLIEETATRSDVVYGFAEVKYKQLIPLAPSTTQGLGIRPQVEPPVNGADPAVDESGLTVDAIVTLSEEALVLYVKALSLLAKAMDIAGAWWARKNRGEPVIDEQPLSPRTIPGGGTTSQNPMIGNRFNSVVQWVRNRFNEVLEKAEFVRLKLLQAQQKLPLEHPSHPNNYPSASTSSTALGGSGDQVIVSAGVTAEKLMYNRALEMSRAAAVNELVGEELKDCEMAYVTAIRLLEAVLEGESDVDGAKPGGPGGRQVEDVGEEEYNPVKGEDRESVVKMIQSIKARVAGLRKKLRVITSRNVPPAASAPSKSPVLPQGAVVPSVAGTPPR